MDTVLQQNPFLLFYKLTKAIPVEENKQPSDCITQQVSSRSSLKPIDVTESQTKGSKYWNEEVAQRIQQYLMCGKYPEGLEPNEKRNFRKRCQNFTIYNGKLHYHHKKDDTLRLAVTSTAMKEQIFQVMNEA